MVQDDSECVINLDAAGGKQCFSERFESRARRADRVLAPISDVERIDGHDQPESDDDDDRRSSSMDDSTPPPPPAAAAEPSPPPPPTTSGSPTDFLKGVVGKRVVVRLTSGVDYRGACPFDTSLLRRAQRAGHLRDKVLERG